MRQHIKILSAMVDISGQGVLLRKFRHENLPRYFETKFRHQFFKLRVRNSTSEVAGIPKISNLKTILYIIALVVAQLMEALIFWSSEVKNFEQGMMEAIKLI
jgi:hypothetical protein